MMQSFPPPPATSRQQSGSAGPEQWKYSCPRSGPHQHTTHKHSTSPGTNCKTIICSPAAAGSSVAGSAVAGPAVTCNWSPAGGPAGCWCRDWCCGHDLEWCSPCIVMLRAVNGTSRNCTVPGEGPCFPLLKASNIAFLFGLHNTINQLEKLEAAKAA